MNKDILYSIAKNSIGQLVKAVDAEKGCLYLCPECNQEFILRKGAKKRPHFSHKALSPNCKPETVLHYGFKTLLVRRIQRAIDQKLPLELRWKCSACAGEHTGNLLKKATSVHLEHDLGACKPDIALLDENGSTVAVIEVVVSHAPEQSALDYYSSNNIAVVCYQLKSDEDINRIDIDILEPDSVDVCKNPKCPECGRHQSKKYLLIIDAYCWKCTTPMKVAALEGDMGYVGDFSYSDIQLAAKYGAFLKLNYSRTVRRRYIANTCRKCNAFIGDHYLFMDYVAIPEYERVRIDAGYYCPYC